MRKFSIFSLVFSKLFILRTVVISLPCPQVWIIFLPKLLFSFSKECKSSREASMHPYTFTMFTYQEYFASAIIFLIICMQFHLQRNKCSSSICLLMVDSMVVLNWRLSPRDLYSHESFTLTFVSFLLMPVWSCYFTNPVY